MSFTTRPEICGTFGAVASTHWIASAVGMRMLELGGTAADAAAAMGFTLNVVEPHLNGPLGDMPAMIWPAGADHPLVICGQGVAPAGATMAHMRAEGLSSIPGSGLLGTVVPGAFDAWMVMLRDHGRLSLREVLSPAIHYARAGHPMLPRAAGVIAGLAGFFRDEWPTSAATWLPRGTAPEGGALFANPTLADTWDRLLTEAEAAQGGRETQIEAARRAFYKGFVAETIDRWMQEACVMDAAGGRRRGVLRGQDMADWEASYEPALDVDYHGWQVLKPGFWSQGPVFLQTLRLLEGMTVDPDRPADFVHLVTEAMKLAFADREAYYGDAPGDWPHQALLGRDYAEARSALIGAQASVEQRPGRLPGFEQLAEAAIARAGRQTEAKGVGAGEPTMAHLSDKRGDTVHIDAIDRWGNMVSATPSGGWLQSSPVVPGLGMPLNSRAQMFWLDEGLPSSLVHGTRPRTTLSPSMARGPDGRRLAFGTPGGDQQDQWQLIWFLRVVHQGLNLQEAVDAPLFHTAHFQGSFWPREVRPGHLMIEPAVGEAVLADLRARGHAVEVAAPWTVGRLTAASQGPDGLIRAAATPRLMQAYAIGR
ncbi:gamma-glutamyltransferase family protein [Seohaeicola nanhaiensis]|uniref:Gamma-glutamyltransferase family protein n=1 Tax=Seohaeicola nanhaiensis TaxID=1387282 RepID=A0ABV9KMR1_9RHOB